jgi:hypothetical protein
MNAQQPSQKVTVSGLAGALSIILVWALGYFWKIVVPPEVASSLTVVVMFLTGYITPPSDNDTSNVSTITSSTVVTGPPKGGP